MPEAIPARPPADLPSLVVDFLNTLDVEAHSDVLDRPLAWSAWAREHQLEAGDADRAREARTAIRELLAGASAGAGVRLPAVSLTVRADAGAAPELVPTEPYDATNAVLGAVATLTARATLPRLKLCVADDCRWAFYDRSKNHSRAWCSMEVCGNRAKSRTHRNRA